MTYKNQNANNARFEYLNRDFKAAENVSFRGTKIMEPEVSIFTI